MTVETGYDHEKTQAESLKSLEKVSVSLHDFFSNYNTMDELSYLKSFL